MKYWHVPCYRWLRGCEVYWLSVPFVVLSKVWPTHGYFTTCSYRHFRSVLDLTEIQPEKLRVRGNPQKGIISVRILRPRGEIRKYETKQNHVRKLRNDSSKWYDWNLKGIRILAFSVRNLRKYEAYLALCMYFFFNKRYRILQCAFLSIGAPNIIDFLYVSLVIMCWNTIIFHSRPNAKLMDLPVPILMHFQV